MSDSELSAHYESARQRDINQRIEQIFSKSIDVLSQEDLAKFVRNFNQRLYLFKNRLPKSMSAVLSGILTHPNLSPTDRAVSVLVSEIRENCCEPPEAV